MTIETSLAGAGGSTAGGGGGGGTVDQGTGAAVADSWSMRIANAGASAFVTPIVAGENVLADLRVGGTAVSGGNPIPVSGPLTDAQLRASPVPVSGTITFTPSGTQNVAAASQAVGAFFPMRETDGTNFRTWQLPVSTPTPLVAPTTVAFVMGRVVSAGGSPTDAKPVRVDLLGNVRVVGSTAVGTSPTEDPVLVAGSDGGLKRIFLTDTSGRQRVIGGASVGVAAAGDPVLTGGQDSQGLARAALLDYRGAMVSAAANMGGDLMTTARTAVCRGISSEGQNFNLFASRTAGSGTVTYNATTGRYDLATTVASLDSAIHVHNSIVHYVENNPMGFAITAALSSTTTTNKRIEFGMMAATATDGTNFLTADRFGFYIENGVLGVFAYSTIAAGYLFQVAQSSWDDPLNGSGRSKRTFTYATALLNQFKLEANQVWLGSDDMEFLVNDVVVYVRDFKFSNPTTNPVSRVPHMRPYVAHHNTGVAAASTVSVNCLEGVRMTQQLPIGRQFTSSRNASRTSLATATEVPVYALRVNSTTKARQFLLERFTARATTQNIRVRCYIGRATDFAITGGTWETPDNNRGTVMEENKATGGEMSWTPTAANLNKIVDDVILSAADVTKEFDTETYFEEGFPLKGDAWLGIDGDGEQRLIVWTATAETGSNGQLNILNVHGREVG